MKGERGASHIYRPQGECRLQGIVRVGESIARLASKADKLPVSELKERLIRLSKESEVLEASYECISMGIVITDSKGIVRAANKAANRLLSLASYTKSKASAAPSTPAASRVPESSMAVWDCTENAQISSFLRDAFLTGGERCDEFSVTSISGNIHFISISIQDIAMEAAGGCPPSAIEKGERGASHACRLQEVPLALITVQDVTEQRKAQIAAHRAQSMAELTNLAANMAHEIKNPLGAISIHVQLIQKALAKEREKILIDEKFLEKPLQAVSEEVSSLNSIVMQFLMAVRPIKASLELLDVCAIIKDTALFVSPEFEKHGFQVKAILAPSATRLLIDARLMKEVLINMAQNSLAALISRFGDEAAGDACDGRFEMAVKVAGDKCIITISDNGIGMAGDAAMRIFEPYFTTKADGTGLGMTMVYKIIKEFNGTVEVKSEPGCGAVFTIKLPLPQTGKRKLIEYSGNKS